MKNLLHQNWEFCPSSWHCTVAIFGTTTGPTLCRSSCSNAEKFHLKDDELFELLETLIAGLKAKGSEDKTIRERIEKFDQDLANLKFKRTNLMIAKIQVEEFYKKDVREAAGAVLREYVWMYGL